MRLIRWAIVAVVCLLTYRVMTISYPLTIEAPAFLGTSVKRAVFATADGYVDALLVEDGQQVEAGKPVARLRSPNLTCRLRIARPVAYFG